MTVTKRAGAVGILAALLNVGLWTAPGLPGAHAANVSATLVRTTNTSGFNPPSPDPSGITYLPASGRLLISDGEVEEMSIWAGKNLFEVTRTGSLTATGTTTAYSREPVGLSLNPSTNRLYVSDDDQMRVFTVAPGGDGRFGTSDDTRTSFSTSTAGNTDPEGVDVDTSTGDLYTVDGDGAEVYHYSAAGTPVSHFDVRVLGARDPEGIAYDPARDRLFVLDHTSQAIYDLTKAGSLVNVISITAAHAVKAAGLTTAPASNGSGATNFYIVDRGVDNDVNPLENDGRIYEMAAGLTTAINKAPTVSAGPDRTVILPAGAALAGTATDDGLPNPPGALTRQWSRVSGPAGGTVTFADPAAASTTATFSAPGVYGLRLTADDSQLSASDEATVSVLPAGTRVLDVAVAAGSDDAEERSNGSVTLNSSDLELTTDGSQVQTVGLRFAAIGVPRGATIQRAYIQFQVDEVSTGAAPLIIAAQATGNAAAFTTAGGNVSSRPRTSPGVVWAPADWTTVGARGPAQQTTDVASALQQVVNLSGWSPGNAMAVIVTGTGRRTAEAFEGSAAPVLHIEYLEGPVANTAPSVDAGPDQTVLLTAGATLSGVVSDDGLPNPPGAVTTGWAKVSGPDGDVAFADPAATSTTATFPVAGVYVLRLTAGDSALTAADDVTITVTEPVPDSERPTVMAVTPLDGATGVAVAGNVTVTFSEPMDPATVTTAGLGLVRTADALAVPAAVTYDGATRTATLNPGADLAAGTGYTATVTTAVADLAGNTLATVHTWSFATAAPATGIRRETSATVVNTAATSTVAIPRPAGTAAGDVLVACLALNGSTVAATGVPAGWTPVASVTSITNPRLYGYYRVAGALEPATYAWTLSTAVANGAGITRYSGVSTTTPLDTAPRTAAGAAATTGTVPGVTTATANAMLVGCMAVNSANTGVTIASPVGMLESFDLGGKRLELADGPQAAPGVSGDKVWTFSASREWAGWLAALRPL
jgi:hypothetical protein